MNGLNKILLLAAVLAIALAGCSDNTEKPVQLTQEQMREAVKDGVLDASKEGKQFGTEERKSGEISEGQARYRKFLAEEERAKEKAQKEWDELQQEKARKEAEKAKAN